MSGIALTCNARLSSWHAVASRPRHSLGSRLAAPRTYPRRMSRDRRDLAQASLLDKLPDFGVPERAKLLNHFFEAIDFGVYDQVLAPDFRMVEEGRVLSKAAWMDVMRAVVAAIPDFNWTHATDGLVDKQGYAIVAVQLTGHHTGAPFQLPGSDLPPVPASGRRVALPEAVLSVKLEGGQIKSIVALPGAGFLALYRALAGGEGATLAPRGPERASYAD